MPGGPLAQHADRLRIDAHGEIRFVLGTIHRSVGSGVDDQVRRDAIQRRAHAFRIGKINPLAVRAVQLAVTGRRNQAVFSRCETFFLLRVITMQMRKMRIQFGRGVPQRKAQGMADLSIGAKQQNACGFVHGVYAGSFPGGTSARKGVPLSLSDSSGSATGQSIASCASFQRMPASAARS